MFSVRFYQFAFMALLITLGGPCSAQDLSGEWVGQLTDPFDS